MFDELNRRLDALPTVAADVLVAVLFVGLAAGLSFSLISLGVTRVSMILLAAVVFTAAARGVRSAMIASVGAYMLFDYVWSAPAYAFGPTTTEEVISLVVFLLVALVTGLASGAQRSERIRADVRARTLLALTQSSTFLAAPNDADAVRAKLAEAVTEVSATGAVVTDAEGRACARAGAGTAWRGALETAVEQAAREALARSDRKAVQHGSFRARALDCGGGAVGAVVWLHPDDRRAVAREVDDYVAMLSELATAALRRALGLG